MNLRPEEEKELQSLRDQAYAMTENERRKLHENIYEAIRVFAEDYVKTEAPPTPVVLMIRDLLLDHVASYLVESFAATKASEATQYQVRAKTLTLLANRFWPLHQVDLNITLTEDPQRQHRA